MSDLPLWPGKKLAMRTDRGWCAIVRPNRMHDLPMGANSGPVCGQWCPPDWGWPPVVCTDHGDGYHAASAKSIWGPRIIAVWLVEAAS